MHQLFTKKIVQVDKKAEKEISSFPEYAQRKFRALLNTLIKQGRLEFPNGKKISDGLFEMRFRYQNTYRSLYAYVGDELIIVLSAFVKKTQRTPIKELHKAKKRLQHYLKERCI